MSSKIKTIQLQRVTDFDKSTPVKRINKFKVLRVTDSLEFNTQDFITAEQAEELCSSSSWKVTLV